VKRRCAVLDGTAIRLRTPIIYAPVRDGARITGDDCSLCKQVCR
jgi:hypothetical protein